VPLKVPEGVLALKQDAIEMDALYISTKRNLWLWREYLNNSG
jgi:hypothetical protein